MYRYVYRGVMHLISKAYSSKCAVKCPMLAIQYATHKTPNRVTFCHTLLYSSLLCKGESGRELAGHFPLLVAAAYSDGQLRA